MFKKKLVNTPVISSTFFKACKQQTSLYYYKNNLQCAFLQRLENLRAQACSLLSIEHRPVHSAPIRLWGSPMALKHTSAIAGAVSRLRLPVPALTEPNFRLSAPISSYGSESRTLVVEKQKVPVDLCHLKDLKNFWKNIFLEIVWNVKYTHKKN